MYALSDTESNASSCPISTEPFIPKEATLHIVCFRPPLQYIVSSCNSIRPNMVSKSFFIDFIFSIIPTLSFRTPSFGVAVRSTSSRSGISSVLPCQRHGFANVYKKHLTRLIKKHVFF